MELKKCFHLSNIIIRTSKAWWWWTTTNGILQPQNVTHIKGISIKDATFMDLFDFSRCFATSFNAFQASLEIVAIAFATSVSKTE